MLHAPCDDSQPVDVGNSKTKPSCTINDLPSEILEHIFCFLNVKERLRTELVCRRWRQISKTVKWRWPIELDVRALKRGCLKNIPLTDRVLASLLSRFGRNLKKLVIEIDYRGYHLINKVLDKIRSCCPNLLEIRLGLEGFPMQDSSAGTALINLGKGCPKLNKVFIGNSHFLDDTVLSLFLKQCHSLERVILSRNWDITEECVSALSPNLKGFYMYSCRRVDIDVVAEKLLDRCDAIEEFCLNGCQGGLHQFWLLAVLFSYKNTLKVVYLIQYTMSPHEWCEISGALHHLEVLSLQDSISVGDDFMRNLAEKCTKLRELDIRGTQVTDVGVSALASAPSLKVLDASWAPNITGVGLRTVASQGRLQKCYFHTYRDESLDEESCVWFANHCPNLQILDVCGNRNITDRLVNEFCSSLERGFLKGPVSLHVKNTSVNGNVKVCAKLKVLLECAGGRFNEIFL